MPTLRGAGNRARHTNKRHFAPRDDIHVIERRDASRRRSTSARRFDKGLHSVVDHRNSHRAGTRAGAGADRTAGRDDDDRAIRERFNRNAAVALAQNVGEVRAAAIGLHGRTAIDIGVGGVDHGDVGRRQADRKPGAASDAAGNRHHIGRVFCQDANVIGRIDIGHAIDGGLPHRL